jgi:MSHA biogenesis protein MshN
MSVINKMLQDLDRRQALAGATDASVVQVRTSAAVHRGGREWLWRIVAVLLTLGLGWVIWVGYQLLPKPLVTNLALRFASEAQTRPIPAQPAPPAPSVTAPSAPSVTAPPPALTAAPDPTPPAPVDARQAAPSDTLRLAREIETPVREPEAARREPAKQEPAKAPTLAAVAPGVAKGTVDKRDRVYSAAETADAQFRRAAVLLNQGRLSEAEDQLAGALRADPSHVAARQTYVAILLEQHRVEAARRLLQEALAINPAQPAFAVALARIYTEQRDYRNALEVLDKAGLAVRNAEFQAMRGAVLQRLGKHAEAVEAYQNAIRTAPQPGTTWVGLAISLETLGRRPEAAQAYRRALDAGSLAAEAREYAESRARALE